MLALFALAIACGDPRGAAPAPAPPTPPSLEPLETLEVITGGASETDALPVVLELHGRGDRPERFRRIFEGFTPRARVVLLRAPIVEDDGLAWFTFPERDTWTHVAREVSQLAERTIATLEAIEARHGVHGVPVVTGFSQGAMMGVHSCPGGLSAATSATLPGGAYHLAEGRLSSSSVGRTHGRKETRTGPIGNRRQTALQDDATGTGRGLMPRTADEETREAHGSRHETIERCGCHGGGSRRQLD